MVAEAIKLETIEQRVVVVVEIAATNTVVWLANNRTCVQLAFIRLATLVGFKDQRAGEKMGSHYLLSKLACPMAHRARRQCDRLLRASSGPTSTS